MTAKPTAGEGMGRVWSSAGLNDDPDIATPGKVAGGWTQEKPPYSFMNWIQRFCTQAINHINEEGISIWDAATTYPIDAFVKGSDGNLYKSLSANDNVDPVGNPATWAVFAGAPSTSDDIGNDSTVVGADVTAALESLLVQISSIAASNVANDSGVGGSDVDGALDILDAAITANGVAIGALDSDDISNVSGVSGADVSAALDTLGALIVALGSDEIVNDSGVTGADVTAALNTLDTAIGALGSDDIGNDSGVAGADVSAALDTLEAAQGDDNAELLAVVSADIPNGTTSNVELFSDIPVDTNTRYTLTGFIFFTGVNTEGCRIDIDGPGAGAVDDINSLFKYNTTNSNPVPMNHRTAFGNDPNTVSVPSSESTATGVTTFELSGSIVIGGTAGSVAFDFAKVASVSQNLVAKEGSWVQLVPLPEP